MLATQVATRPKLFALTIDWTRARALQLSSFVAGNTTSGEVRLLHRDDSIGGKRRQGRYVLGELLGRGGMAEVFAGHSMGSHGFQKPVAIKRLLPELANDHVFVERLIGEAKLLVGMQHGNIVSVLDLARDGDDVFLVMEFVDGPTLRQLLKARGQRGLPISVATYIVQSAAAGLEFAHARPGGAVIHADISPSNLLLTTSGEVRVADFGIARREGGGAGVVEGKWAYMAPEQARGEPLTPRSDVFALGVVLYELIVGQHPLGRQVTAEERDSEPVRIIPPRVVKPNIPPGIDAICMRALSHDPRQRYGRMQQLIDALVEERFANGWREGASDLAQVIREVRPGVATPGPKTQITDRPVTIVTRSLISQPQRLSSPRLASEPDLATPAALFAVPPSPDTTAQTRAIVVDPIHHDLRADGTPQPQLLQLAAAMLPAPELASVHGGTFTGSAAITVEPARNTRWTLGVLGLAAVAGAVAAVAIQLAPGGHVEAAAAPVAVTRQVAPAPIVTPLPDPAPAPTDLQAALEAPAPKPEPKPDAVATETAKPEVKPALVAKPVPEPRGETIETRIAARRHNAAKAAPAKKAADAFLRVDDWKGNWAHIIIGNEFHDAPRARFHLPAGTYTMRVSNDFVRFTCRVTLESGKTTTVKLSMEDSACE
jgi:eukaryotic-like serine/threonine-protein kinase